VEAVAAVVLVTSRVAAVRGCRMRSRSQGSVGVGSIVELCAGLLELDEGLSPTITLAPWPAAVVFDAPHVALWRCWCGGRHMSRSISGGGVRAIFVSEQRLVVGLLQR
jgi:hypothetical protein